MILSFGDKATAALYTVRAAKLSAGFRRMPPGNRLETLRGDLFGCHSIRVNDQWRLVFRWAEGNAHDVSLSDYH